ncbi:hypothetical protein EDD57_11722 [Baia soyae]|uniref:Uncharacterized protein n=1 Tax=Baia soyae TaxID=1544746 RepID=A0A4R2SAU3_9BACL|nr:hypothetical protein EDD57_11722 [Baia soyae]
MMRIMVYVKAIVYFAFGLGVGLLVTKTVF